MSSLGLFMREPRSAQLISVTSHVMLVSRASLYVPNPGYTLLDDDGVASLELSGATVLELDSAVALELEMASVPESDDVVVSDDSGPSDWGPTELSLSPPQLAQKRAAEDNSRRFQCFRMFIGPPNGIF